MKNKIRNIIVGIVAAATLVGVSVAVEDPPPADAATNYINGYKCVSGPYLHPDFQAYGRCLYAPYAYRILLFCRDWGGNIYWRYGNRASWPNFSYAQCGPYTVVSSYLMVKS